MSNQFRTFDEPIEEREKQNDRNYQFTIRDTREVAPDSDGMIAVTSENSDTGVVLKVEAIPLRNDGYSLRISRTEEIIKFYYCGDPTNGYNFSINEIDYITAEDMRRLAHILLGISNYIETADELEEVTVTTQERTHYDR